MKGDKTSIAARKVDGCGSEGEAEEGRGDSWRSVMADTCERSEVLGGTDGKRSESAS
jgi:hypothetical protein